MAEQLEQAEQEFLEHYLGYLQTVEEGIGSVAYFYREGFEENGDRLLNQMLDGFDAMSSGSMTMDYLFAQKAGLKGEMETFHEKIEEAKTIPSLSGPEEKMQALTAGFTPAFQRWKVFVENMAAG
ncbi:hypothetical protein [Salibacterium aidingense]|uniref:hypothetical protein n=1 Tax=Salibacterium aidingense TaxID=384933 RepID=UPI0004079D37|nr:hypothetical protein [Salibacterium aidingense]